LRATGSAAHWQKAQQIAAGCGLELRDDGLYKGDKALPVASEEEVYAALGVPFIAPELREDLGEWEAAQKGALPNLLQIGDIKGDLHAHSTWSDGTATIRQMVIAARERGYQYHAITDHSKALAMTNGLDAHRLREQAKEIAEVQAEFPDIKVLRGIECDILRDGTLDLDDDILHELDIVIASVHSAFKLEEAAQTERMIRALSHPAVDLVAHPTGRIVGGRPGYNVNIEAVIEAAHATGTALEINASERLDLRDSHARMARERGVLLCIDTDAHSTRMLDNLMLGILTARRAWCEPHHVINTKPVDELMAWLQRPQSGA
jgi:DNA polymerase (family 10)